MRPPDLSTPQTLPDSAGRRDELRGQFLAAAIAALRDVDPESFERASRLMSTPGVDINEQGERGHGALHFAVEFPLSPGGPAAMLHLLLAQPGINVNIRDRHGMTPLYCAVRSRNIAMVKMLLERPDTEVDTPSSEGVQPLLLATHLDQPEILALLLARPDLDIEAGGAGELSAPLRAMRDASDEIISLLLTRCPLGTGSELGDQILAMAAQKPRLAQLVAREASRREALRLQADTPLPTPALSHSTHSLRL